MQCSAINLTSPRYLTIRTIFDIKMLIMNILIIAFNPSHVHPTTLNVTLQITRCLFFPPLIFPTIKKKEWEAAPVFPKKLPICETNPCYEERCSFDGHWTNSVQRKSDAFFSPILLLTCTETFQWEPSEGFHLVAATSLNLSAICLSACMAECICAVQLCVCVCMQLLLYLSNPAPSAT